MRPVTLPLRPSGRYLQFGAYGCEQIARVEWFFKKHPPTARRLVLRGGELVTASDQNNWQSWPGMPDNLLKFEPVRVRHANVRYNAVNVGDCRIQELLCGNEQPDPVPSQLEQIFKQFEDSVVVINYRHYRLCGRRHDYLLFLLSWDKPLSIQGLSCFDVIWMRRGYIQPFGHAHQVRDRTRLHLVHDFAPVNLERNFADTQFRSSLFVQ